jgi:aryl-alcohol dehydrogenase-like predicted oxidoreductase
MAKIAATEIGDFGLGTVQFVFGPESTREAAIQVVHAAVANGVRLIDTARAYTRRGVEALARPSSGTPLLGYLSPITY